MHVHGSEILQSGSITVEHGPFLLHFSGWTPACAPLLHPPFSCNCCHISDRSEWNPHYTVLLSSFSHIWCYFFKEGLKERIHVQVFQMRPCWLYRAALWRIKTHVVLFSSGYFSYSVCLRNSQVCCELSFDEVFVRNYSVNTCSHQDDCINHEFQENRKHQCNISSLSSQMCLVLLSSDKPKDLMLTFYFSATQTIKKLFVFSEKCIVS